MHRLTATAAVLICISLPALARDINPDANAATWRQAKSAERAEYAAMASIMCQSSTCNGAAIKACMDEVTRPPAPAGLSSMTIGGLAINCIKMIKAQ